MNVHTTHDVGIISLHDPATVKQLHFYPCILGQSINENHEQVKKTYTQFSARSSFLSSISNSLQLSYTVATGWS